MSPPILDLVGPGAFGSIMRSTLKNPMTTHSTQYRTRTWNADMPSTRTRASMTAFARTSVTEDTNQRRGNRGAGCGGGIAAPSITHRVLL